GDLPGIAAQLRRGRLLFDPAPRAATRRLALSDDTAPGRATPWVAALYTYIRHRRCRALGFTTLLVFPPRWRMVSTGTATLQTL
ncbi:MAG: hypothetical protein ACK4FW_08005, partial [Stenotrophomonas sp.]